MNGTRPPFPPPRAQEPIGVQMLSHILGGSLIWVFAAFVAVALLLLTTLRFEQVSGEQVGLLLNRISGEIEVITQSGVKIYNGLLSEFYVLDKTLQSLEMTESVGRGDRRGRDDLKVKTVDGSDVYVDLKIQYRINPDMALEVITSSGTGDNYKKKWIRDYVRSIARNYLGELTTEEFYDASKRDAQIVLALNDVNARLKPFGLIIDNIVIPQRPHFYAEYEELIKKKKLADQGVQEEQSKALAAKQKQLTQIVLETNKKNVAVEQFEGEMRKKIIVTEADADRSKKEADAYYEQKTVSAEAMLYASKKEAEGALALKKAEAEGIMALKNALEGEGGRNMVKLEYARKLKNLTLSGKPVTIDNRLERFEHQQEGAAAIKRN